MSLISKSPTISVEPQKSSAQVSIQAGSGSRPTPSKYKIATSAPENPRTLGRDVPGSLK